MNNLSTYALYLIEKHILSTRLDPISVQYTSLNQFNLDSRFPKLNISGARRLGPSCRTFPAGLSVFLYAQVDQTKFSMRTRAKIPAEVIVLNTIRNSVILLKRLLLEGSDTPSLSEKSVVVFHTKPHVVDALTPVRL